MRFTGLDERLITKHYWPIQRDFVAVHNNGSATVMDLYLQLSSGGREVHEGS